MKDEKQTITPLMKERAKQYHDLWEKGYTVAEAADKMGITEWTIYKQLDVYAEINGVKDKYVYIKEYAERTINPKIVTLSTENKGSDDGNEITINNELSKKCFTELLALCDELMDECKSSIESADSILEKTTLTSIKATDIKEENV
ncbi:MAG: hypothetical protein IKN65_03645 [Clostridia bacterium]|nr:hypothetical protein [Clostridia bacterium]